MKVKRPIKLSPSSAPGVGDDAADGFSPGWEWCKLSTGDLWICTDATIGAAVWVQVNGGGGGAVSSVNARTGAVVLVGTDIPNFIASGVSHAKGAVPDPGITAGTTKFLREDATWQVPAGGGGSNFTRSIVDYLSNNGIALPVLTASNTVTGMRFIAEKPMTITGARFYSASTNKTIRCKLWDFAGTLLKTVDLLVAAPGVFTAVFGVAEVVGIADIYKEYTISMFVVGGTELTSISDANVGTDRLLTYPLTNFDGITYINRKNGTGDIYPATAATVVHYPIEPVYS